jgi:chromate transporter
MVFFVEENFSDRQELRYAGETGSIRGYQRPACSRATWKFDTKSRQRGCETPCLASLFFSFLKLGVTAFGGPAMVAYVGKLAVEQKRWLNDQTFRDGVALCQTIPGATAMQTSAYVVLERAEWPVLR